MQAPLRWGALMVLVWLALLLASLERPLMQDVDEVLYARVAQSAALHGEWWPLQLEGRPFYEKPPWLPWLAGATAKLSGQPYAAWPYRMWTAMGAALGLASLLALGALLKRPWAGVFAAGLLALQGDWILHARFFTFDAPFVGWSLAAAAAGVWAAQGAVARWWLPGLGLALAAASKSWFVLGLVPAWAFSLRALPPSQRRAVAVRLAIPPLLALGLWAALYATWHGWGFFQQEWQHNLFGRLLGRSNETDLEGHAAFYLKWAQRSAPALLPLLLAGLLGMRPWGREQGPEAWARSLAWAWAASWLLGLAVVRAETINYLLPLEAALCLLLGLGLDRRLGAPRDRGLAVGLLLAALAAGGHGPAWMWLALGVPLGFWWRQGLNASPQAQPRIPWRWAASVLLLLALLPDVWRLLRRPLDPHRQLWQLLQDNPPRYPAEPLVVVGGSTPVVEFYARHQVRRLDALPAKRPAEAALVQTVNGWQFYPALERGRP